MSTLKTNTLSNVAGTASTAIENAIHGSAKAWVNFNGTGTVAIRASYNVSSITDNGTGDYTVNFTNAMIDANYNMCGTGDDNAAASGVLRQVNATKTASACRVNTCLPGSTVADAVNVSVSIFR